MTDIEVRTDVVWMMKAAFLTWLLIAAGVAYFVGLLPALSKGHWSLEGAMICAGVAATVLVVTGAWVIDGRRLRGRVKETILRELIAVREAAEPRVPAARAAPGR